MNEIKQINIKYEEKTDLFKKYEIERDEEINRIKDINEQLRMDININENKTKMYRIKIEEKNNINQTKIKELEEETKD